jgi:hypothetical protein
VENIFEIKRSIMKEILRKFVIFALSIHRSQGQKQKKYDSDKTD